MNLLPHITDSPWQIVKDNKNKHKSSINPDADTKSITNKQGINTHAFVVAKGTMRLFTI